MVLVPWEQNPKKIKWYAYKIHGNSVKSSIFQKNVCRYYYGFLGIRKGAGLLVRFD
jgi:hypothetical protein